MKMLLTDMSCTLHIYSIIMYSTFSGVGTSRGLGLVILNGLIAIMEKQEAERERERERKREKEREREGGKGMESKGKRRK